MGLYSGWRQVVAGRVVARLAIADPDSRQARSTRQCPGKAAAAGHAPHPVVDGTRTPHILPSRTTRRCANQRNKKPRRGGVFRVTYAAWESARSASQVSSSSADWVPERTADPGSRQ